jgi:hypothetical protein
MSHSLLTLALVAAFLGQSPADPPSSARAAGEDRREMLAFLRDKAAELTLAPESGEPLPLRDEPVIHYSNAERDIGAIEGATFLWLDGNRPLAAVSMATRPLQKAIYRELASFTTAPLVCHSGEAIVWAPKTGGLVNQNLSGSPTPAAGKPQRLIQMRSLARRFKATCYNPRTDEPTELRLLPQPLYRYADDKTGVLDGALFAFVVSNDPELFLLLEARAEVKAGQPPWRYSLTRMSSLKEIVRLDDKEVWSVPSYWRDPAEDRKTGPYVEAKAADYDPTSATSE